MKTVLNDLCSHISYERDGRLVHTDKNTGVQMVSIYTWPSLSGAREALANAFGKIEWQKFNEPPPQGVIKTERSVRRDLVLRAQPQFAYSRPVPLNLAPYSPHLANYRRAWWQKSQ